MGSEVWIRDSWWEEYETADRRAVTLPIIELVVTQPPVALPTAQDRIDARQLKTIDAAHAEEALRPTDPPSASARGLLAVQGARAGGRLDSPARLPL